MRVNEYSLATLFKESLTLDNGTITKIQRIEIPRIQRDYAQGRRIGKVPKLRDKFLSAIYQALSLKKPLALDFVYGDVTEGCLIPLDGQQRITTLFLLHWYASRKDLFPKSDDCVFLKNFSYETRAGSRYFYQQLCKFWPNDISMPLSEVIKDQSWFQLQWGEDPTVDSMLVMLDEIQRKFCHIDGLWELLVEKNIITFYFKALNDLGVTDEIYIKMNSRGKPLTPFEHFKSEFGTIVEGSLPEKKSLIDNKIDVEWTRMLFKYRGANNTIDDEFMRYFHFVCSILCFQQNLPEEADDFVVAVTLFGKENPKAKTNLLYLESMFDCWCSYEPDEFFHKVFSGKEHEDKKVQIYQDNVNLFQECCEKFKVVDKGQRRPFPLPSMLMLYAVTEYLRSGQSKEENSTDLNEFRRRLRIVRNLVWNSSDEIRVTDNAMRILLGETEKIISKGVVPGLDLAEQGYNANQKKEEIEKKEWLANHQAAYSLLCKLEDHKLLQGSVAIVGLDNLGLTDTYYELFDKCSYDLIGRALLTYGDYSQTIDWRVQLGNGNDSVWRDLFHVSRNRKGFERTSQCLIALLKSLEKTSFSPDSVLAYVHNYHQNPEVVKDWRYYFIKYASMRNGASGRYHWPEGKTKNPYCIIMMNTYERLSGYHWEVFSKELADSYPGLFSLGSDAMHGDLLTVNGQDINIEFGQNTLTIREKGHETHYKIVQKEGVDIDDRVEWAKRTIDNYLSHRFFSNQEVTN